MKRDNFPVSSQPMAHSALSSALPHPQAVSHGENEAEHRGQVIAERSAHIAPMLDLLGRMRAGNLSARRDPIDADFVILVRQQHGGSLGAGRARRALVDHAIEAGLMRRAGSSRFVLCEPASCRPDAESQPSRSGPQAPRLNDAESPLMWLYRRKGPDGNPLLDERCFLAGERFRRDVTQAAMLPNVTTNWSRLEASTGRATPRDPALASDVVIAARQRVRVAYKVLGPDMGNFVLDVCGFLAPLQDAENRRSWPARSGKLVLKMALSLLAAHYGIQTEATGTSRADLTSWHAGQDRADMQTWLLRKDG